VANESSPTGWTALETTLFDKAGVKVGTAESTLEIAPGTEMESSQQFKLTSPSLWSPDSPSLYRAFSQVKADGKVVDQVNTTFGIRSLAWSAEKACADGKPIKLTGGSVHHDKRCARAAAFDRAEQRRVELLRLPDTMPCEPPTSPIFCVSDACDRLGLLVLDEPFDVWKAHKVKYDYGSDFEQWWKQDVSSMVLRDRNHPR
jgi:beta-galactosidase